MYILVLLMPLLSAIISGLFGRKIGTKGVGVLTSTCISISVIISSCIFYETVLNSSPTYIKLWRWFDSDLLITYFGLQFDSITSIMLIVITSVSALVHIYSIGYMSGDPHIPRFMSYLSLFTFLMIVLVTSDNFIQLFIGWEGVGLCSYLLINFWLTRIKANKAAMKAMLINRVGDIGLVLAMIKIFDEFGTLEFSTIYSIMSLSSLNLYIDKESITIICLLLFLGAVGKSAQLGLHTWLPDAMEGPTPVSALIHAATMVTAGVFLIIRSGPLFEGSPLALTVVTVLGAMTAFFAATTGVVQNDLKKVIAYSTCSQLGYMVMVCGLSNYSTSLFHLMNHAFFKALLFLSAGSVIHAISDEQDMRKMGGLIKSIPFTYTMILIGSLSLMGFPYLTGFYSKDLILELTYDKYYIAFAYWLGSLSALLTAFYSMRLIYLTFITNTNSKKEILIGVHEPSLNIIFPLLLLAFGSIFVGYWGKEVILSNVIPPIVSNSIKAVPLIFSLLGAFLAFVVYDRLVRVSNIWYYPINYKKIIAQNIKNEGLFLNLTGGYSGRIIGSIYHMVYTFLNSAWQFNYVINHFFVRNIWKFGHLITYRVIDRGILEVIGPRGISRIFIKLTQFISNLQSGMVFNYALIMIVFTTLFLSGASIL
uniref:NADH-ubiquinone oxidoreductase chain 5 n=1 Tax=Cliona patera TaxID=2910015 RepID=A0A9E8YZS5_9METZ|nr:NADH dehydrogenase subunit 5 [Cliona patera]WAK85271.1 NADH dehydrogenase subunit 5 [Cliona patera]WAK85285.1 NADH dehydrogenase subunit 5 [Cliona patera]WAK85299.1 NADH dehydrogenase subunit 5 [Cliona patera]WAK85313.1 NADH dehydrogenase subunit 5 [Cliona patera]WAK85327.1 NADH dehydrogenase subunit 5 [Cliona patera]